jgi:8-oxo-dGTP pyrophosphatase MutT (NUDIX family)
MIPLSGENFTFTEFKNSVKVLLQERTCRKIETAGYRQSAVLILLFEKNRSPHVLITKRSEKVAVHKGQMSLPGGSLDPKDSNLTETALRETEEETGIARSKIEIIGRFDDYISITGFNVAVYAGCMQYPVEYAFNKDEIDDYVEVPLEIFTRQEGLEFDSYTYYGTEIKSYRYIFNGNKIWGLTSMIVTDFVQKIIL